MMFAFALLKVLEQGSRAADGLSAVLFVYDDLGDGFSAVASLGGPIDAVVAGSDNVLGHALESRQIACEALDSGLLPEPSGLERLIGPDPALLVPLFGEYDLGVAAIRGAQSTFHTLMRDPQSLPLLASTA